MIDQYFAGGVLIIFLVGGAICLWKCLPTLIYGFIILFSFYLILSWTGDPEKAKARYEAAKIK